MESVLTLSEHPAGVEVGPGNVMTYDLEAGIAHSGSASVAGPALLWQLTPVEYGGRRRTGPAEPALAETVMLTGSGRWLMRCDRVDFPPGAVAYRHVHPGPGIRRLLFGELTVTIGGISNTHRAGDSWFERGPEPVHAESSLTQPSAFVRVMLLPARWAGRRTIRYMDPADASRTARQRATVLGEEPLV